MADQLYEINRTLGSILNKLENLDEEMKKSEETALRNRSSVHQRLDEVLDRTHSLETDMESIKKKVADSAAVTEKVKQWEQRGIGALFVTGLASASISAWVMYMFSDFIKYMKGL